MFTYEQYQESAAFLQKRLGDFQPELLLILGSGLGFLAGEVEGASSKRNEATRLSKLFHMICSISHMTSEKRVAINSLV